MVVTAKMKNTCLLWISGGSGELGNLSAREGSLVEFVADITR